MTGSKAPKIDQLLTYRIHALNKLTERGASERIQLKTGVTMPEGRVVLAVGAFGPFSIMNLARHANLDKSQASRAADALIQRGLLQRQPSAEDGRVVMVSLTTEGMAVYRKLLPLSRKWNDDLMSTLTEAERTALSRALDKVIAHARGLVE
jgi:DNA-binding MarR family transcriptional regulator